MTLTSYQLQDHRKRPCAASPPPAATPAGTRAPRTTPADPHPRPPLSARPQADGLRFPALLRNDFAAVIFALIVQGRCLCVALSLPGAVIAAYAVLRGPDRSPSLLPTAARREG